ncbi:MAG TPA: twin-arginine translocation signal domain-containing protein [Pyrinomonadaceae bacterium]
MKENKQPTGSNTHNRRDFLVKTAVAAAGLVIVSSCASSSDQSSARGNGQHKRQGTTV